MVDRLLPYLRLKWCLIFHSSLFAKSERVRNQVVSVFYLLSTGLTTRAIWHVHARFTKNHRKIIEAELTEGCGNADNHAFPLKLLAEVDLVPWRVLCQHFEVWKLVPDLHQCGDRGVEGSGTAAWLDF